MKKILLVIFGVFFLSACSSPGGADASIIQQKNVTMKECERMESPLKKDRCVRKVAESQNNFLLCEKINDPIQKPICFNSILRKQLSATVCSGLKTDQKKIKCQHAAYSNLMELVQRCMRSPDMGQCISNISQSTTASDFCSLHQDQKIQRCLERFDGV